MKEYTLLEALKEIAIFFPYLNFDNLNGIRYEEGSKNKFILDFVKHKILINLDDVTHKLIE
jgi:hypothetical protein